MFTKSQKDLLKSVGRNLNHPNFGKANPELDEVILKLRRDNPNAFLKDSDLRDRVFVNQPVSNIEMRGYVYPMLEAK
jgi:hypothetical protein